MVFARITLFALMQTLIAFVFLITGNATPWESSINWWVLSVTLADLISIILLDHSTKAEGLRLKDIYTFYKKTWKKDILVTLLLFLIAGPIGFFPNGILATWLWGDPNAVLPLMFRPLPYAVVITLTFIFPIVNALTELPIYFGYSMPRLEIQWKNRWLAWALTGFMLSAQHIAFPLIFDGKFILWRLGMYLPFALIIAFFVRWRPRLLPYFMVVHGLMDLSLGFYLIQNTIR